MLHSHLLSISSHNQLSYIHSSNCHIATLMRLLLSADRHCSKGRFHIIAVPLPLSSSIVMSSSMRLSLRRLVPAPAATSTSASRLCSTPACPSPASPFIQQSVRNFASPILPRASSSQAPRSSGSAVASLGLPTGFPALSIKQTADKTPMEYIAEIAPKEVEGSTAVCEGGQPLNDRIQRAAPPLTPALPHSLIVTAIAVCGMVWCARRRSDGSPRGVHPAQQGQPQRAIHLPLLRTAIRTEDAPLRERAETVAESGGDADTRVCGSGADEWYSIYAVI